MLMIDLINELRHSGHGTHVGMVFMGCILYADDIVLLSGSCYGLQKVVDICGNYGHRFDIKFNPLWFLEGLPPLVLFRS